jgi:hypothetical protein
MANRISASEFNIEIPKMLNRINEATGSPIRPYNAGCSVITAGHYYKTKSANGYKLERAQAKGAAPVEITPYASSLNRCEFYSFLECYLAAVETFANGNSNE